MINIYVCIIVAHLISKIFFDTYREMFVFAPENDKIPSGVKKYHGNIIVFVIHHKPCLSRYVLKSCENGRSQEQSAKLKKKIQLWRIFHLDLPLPSFIAPSDPKECTIFT